MAKSGRGAQRTTVRLALAAAAMLLALVLTGCGGGGSAPAADGQPSGGGAFAPEFHDAPYDLGQLNGSEDAGIEVTHAAQGYVVAVGRSEQPLKFTVTCGDSVTNFDLPNDGTPTVFPLTAGDGTYRLAILENTTGSRYAEVFAGTMDVEMESEFAPFVRPSVWCSYDRNSACVAKAAELTAECGTQTEAVAAVFDFVTENIEYDVDKADELSGKSGYVPDPDRTLEEGQGICSDYASLTAAMLRSQGIPAKVIVGRVMPDDFIHAWNLVYVDGSWRTVQVDVQAGEWSVLDATFAADGSSPAETEYYEQYAY
ncbi:MAG: transglutaminase-like domain-containing protein [Coriobacteriia bacterium]|nr:transglutaminase-like domain-containing protein [Coriobacteriia bacterium]